LIIGSGTCVEIGDRCFIATAGHNLDGAQLSNIELVLSGRKTSPEIEILAGKYRTLPDVGWLEVDLTFIREYGISPVPLTQLAPLRDDESIRVPVMLQGYPGARVKISPNSANRPGVESTGLLTLVVPPSKRSSLAAGVDFSIEYPTWDGTTEEAPPPPGESGGGIWVPPKFKPNTIWEPGQAKMVGLVESWVRRTNEVFCVRIEQWLDALAEDIPELAPELKSFLAGASSVPQEDT
jgi:hypothetical protein